MNETQTIPAPEHPAADLLARLRQYRFFHPHALMLIGLTLVLALLFMWLPPADRFGLATSLIRNRTLIVLLLAFSLLTLSLLWSFGQKLDAALFLFFNLRGFHPIWLDQFMWLATQLGNMGVALVVAAILFLAGNDRLAIELVLGVLTLWFVVELIKAFTDRRRPFTTLTDARIIGWRELGLSFPSGHTAQAFFVTSLLSHHFQIHPVAATLLLVVAALVGFTRIYVSAHYPRDVIGGAIVGFAWGIIAILIDPYI